MSNPEPRTDSALSATVVPRCPLYSVRLGEASPGEALTILPLPSARRSSEDMPHLVYCQSACAAEVISSVLKRTIVLTIESPQPSVPQAPRSTQGLDQCELIRPHKLTTPAPRQRILSGLPSVGIFYGYIGRSIRTITGDCAFGTFAAELGNRQS